MGADGGDVGGERWSLPAGRLEKEEKSGVGNLECSVSGALGCIGVRRDQGLQLPTDNSRPRWIVCRWALRRSSGRELHKIFQQVSRLRSLEKLRPGDDGGCGWARVKVGPAKAQTWGMVQEHHGDTWSDWSFEKSRFGGGRESGQRKNRRRLVTGGRPTGGSRPALSRFSR
ncbi:hypothetical protein BKA81DRAFT_368887, partial [Phyllosticta paracitricarpa]